MLSCEDIIVGMVSRSSLTCASEGEGAELGARRFLKNLTPSSRIRFSFVMETPESASLIWNTVLDALFYLAVA